MKTEEAALLQATSKSVSKNTFRHCFEDPIFITFHTVMLTSDIVVCNNMVLSQSKTEYNVENSSGVRGLEV